MARKRKKVFAFVAVHPQYGLNPYWVRAMASQIRKERDGQPWQNLRRNGWRIAKVELKQIGAAR